MKITHITNHSANTALDESCISLRFTESSGRQEMPLLGLHDAENKLRAIRMFRFEFQVAPEHEVGFRFSGVVGMSVLRDNPTLLWSKSHLAPVHLLKSLRFVTMRPCGVSVVACFHVVWVGGCLLPQATAGRDNGS